MQHSKFIRVAFQLVVKLYVRANNRIVKLVNIIYFPHASDLNSSYQGNKTLLVI